MATPPAGLASVGGEATAADRLRVVVALAAVGDPHRTDLRAQTVTSTARTLIATMVADRVDAVLVPGDTLLFMERRRIVELAREYRLPAMYSSREFAQAE